MNEECGGITVPADSVTYNSLQAENARLVERVQELEEERRETYNKPPRERFYCRGCTLPGIETRLAEAEGLLKELEWVYPEVGGYMHSCPCCGAYEGKPHKNACALNAFLHPEQAEKAETIRYMNEVSAEVEQWPAEKQGLLDSHATGYEKEKRT